MNPIYVDEPDPAAHLLPEWNEAWTAYRARLAAEPEVRDRWLRAEEAVERARKEAGWPRLKEEYK